MAICELRGLPMNRRSIPSKDRDTVQPSPTRPTTFFAGTRIRANFICGLGYGSDERLFPRLPRLSFDEAGWLA